MVKIIIKIALMISSTTFILCSCIRNESVDNSTDLSPSDSSLSYNEGIPGYKESGKFLVHTTNAEDYYKLINENDFLKQSYDTFLIIEQKGFSSPRKFIIIKKNKDEVIVSYKELFSISKERNTPELQFENVTSLVNKSMIITANKNYFDSLLDSLIALQKYLMPFTTEKEFYSHKEVSAELNINGKYFLFNYNTLNEDGYRLLNELWISLVNNQYINSLLFLKSEDEGFNQKKL